MFPFRKVQLIRIISRNVNPYTVFPFRKVQLILALRSLLAWVWVVSIPQGTINTSYIVTSVTSSLKFPFRKVQLIRHGFANLLKRYGVSIPQGTINTWSAIYPSFCAAVSIPQGTINTEGLRCFPEGHRRFHSAR